MGSEIEKQVARLLDEGPMVDAVLLVRRELQLGLKQAVTFIDAIRDQYFDRTEAPGMSVHVFGVGSFSNAIVDHLNYSAKYYASMSAGRPVCVSALEFYATSLAVISPVCAAIGISDPTDIGQHAINNANVDFDALRTSLAVWADWESPWIADEVDRFELLINAGFRFYLRVDDWDIVSKTYVLKADIWE